jgi:hypothetical protein
MIKRVREAAGRKRDDRKFGAERDPKLFGLSRKDWDKAQAGKRKKG